MTVRVAVAGASGYAGGELLRLLATHPGVEIGAVTAHSNAGRRVGDTHPHLSAFAGHTLEPTSAEVLRGHDVVFLTLPHGESAPLAGALGDTLIVDCARALRQQLLGAEVMGSMSPYGVGGGHRHTPELTQNLSRVAGERVTVSFTPTLAPMPRGILATCSARLRQDAATAGEDEVRAAYEAAYADEPFVRLLPPGQWPSTAAVVGSNTALVQVAVDPDCGRLICVSAIDNLTKGTAGGAVQSMNVALGLPERLGLPTNGVAP